MVNLLAVDAQSLTEVPIHIAIFTNSTISIALTILMLWSQLGLASFAGVTLMVVIIPVTFFLTNKVKSFQIKRLGYQDSRIKTINELLNGIKVVKFYAWELSFKSIISKIRETELKFLKIISYLNGTTSFILNTTPLFVSIVSFGIYILINKDDPLNAEKAFISLALFNGLRQTLLHVPGSLSSFVQVINQISF